MGISTTVQELDGGAPHQREMSESVGHSINRGLFDV